MNQRIWGLVVVLLIAITSQAEVREFDITQPVTQPHCSTPPPCYWYGEGPLSNPFIQNEPESLIDSIHGEYDNVTKRYRFEAVMKDNPAISGNKIASSFWMVLNHGPMPFSIGTASIIYLDGTNPAAPKLTAYGYNNGHDLFDRSWEDGNRNVAGNQAPDKICTSVNPASCPGWVRELSVVNTNNGGVARRTFTFEIDATPILNHVPLYNDGGTPPSPWHSPSVGTPPRIFDSLVGIWFHYGITRSFGYDADGYISDVNEYNCGDSECDPVAGYYDGDNLTTTHVNQPPLCSLALASQDPLSCGGAITTVPLSVVATDPDGEPLTKTYTVSCSSGSGTVVENGGTAAVNISGPGLGNNTSCGVSLQVSDGLSSAMCGAEFNVPGCNLDCLNNPNGGAVIDACGVCNGNNACVDCAGQPFGGRTYDRCGICGGNGDSCLGCQDRNNTGSIFDADGFALQAKLIVKEASRTLGRYNHTTKRWAKYRADVDKKANTLYVTAWSAIWSIPVSSQLCSNSTFCASVSFDSTISTYSNSVTDLIVLAKKVISQKGGMSASDKRKLTRTLTNLEKRSANIKASLPTSQSMCS